MDEKVRKTVLIVGSGAWGTAIATQMNKNHKVIIYCIENRLYNEMKYQRTNNAALPGIKIDEDIDISNDFNAIHNSSFIIIAVPSNSVEDVVKQISLLSICNEVPIIIASKGIKSDGTLLYDVCEKYLKNPIAILAGPNIAIEIAQNKPSIAIIASKNKSTAVNLSETLSSDTFHLTPTESVIPVQIAGCIKNIAATICGISNQIYNSQNLQSCLINKALKEIITISDAISPISKMHINIIEEIYNEAVLGDLILCCYSNKSRNNAFGTTLVQTSKQERKIFIKHYPVLIESKENAQKIFNLEKKLGIQSNLFAITLCKILESPELLEQYIEYMVNKLINRYSVDKT